MFRCILTLLLSGIAGLPALADHCFQREYSDAHLAANKNQTVKTLKVRLPQARSDQAHVWVVFRKTFTELEAEAEAAASASQRGEDPPKPKKPRLYKTGLYCWAPAPGTPEDAWQCGVECDGGTFTAWESGGSLLLRTRGGFLASGECSEPGDQEPPRYVTDINAIETTFRLDPVDISNCDLDE